MNAVKNNEADKGDREDSGGSFYREGRREDLSWSLNEE